MTALPLVTIGMTCFNAQATIARALRSALAQDWPNKQIIVVDDASADDSVGTVRALAAAHPEIRLIVHDHNKGVGGALNTMLAHAHGEFVVIFDDDDESAPERIATQLRALTDYEARTGQKLVACYASGVRVYPNGYEHHFAGIGSRPRAPQGQDMLDYFFYGRRDPAVFYGAGTPGCALMARRATFQAAGSYDETLRRNEDSDFAVRLAKIGGHFTGCAEEVVRQHATAGSDKRPLIAYKSECAFIDKYKADLNRAGRYGFARAWARLRFYHYDRKPVQALLTLILLFIYHPLLTARQFLRTAPARLRHEQRISS